MAKGVSRMVISDLISELDWMCLMLRSLEENCLVWVVEVVRGTVSDGWHSASCCNMHQYVCSSQTLS